MFKKTLIVLAVLLIPATVLASDHVMMASGSSGWTYGEENAITFARGDAHKEGRSLCSRLGGYPVSGSWEDPATWFCGHRADPYGVIRSNCSGTVTFRCRVRD